MTMRFDGQLWSQNTGWPEVRETATALEAAGWDGIWTWDHLMAIFGPWDQPIFEGWGLMHAVAAVTRRMRIGLMVGANTLRNPALTVKLATTLDHVSEGRAILGIGGAWFQREHDAYGFTEFGTGPGERLDRLDEAVALMRRLLDGERFDHEGRFYRFHEALALPRPVQPRLPILVGGSGPRKTLRTTGRLADAWNTSGTLEEVGRSVETLEAHCADAGRDPNEIERTVSFPIVIRDTAPAAEEAFAGLLAHNGASNAGVVPTLLGPPELVADRIRPYREELGFRTVIVRLPAPYDRETIDRIGEVREALAS